eukprot:scaffold3967_cov126-Skeletonema_dohrnii-CCMP3373.AAC.3
MTYIYEKVVENNAQNKLSTSSSSCPFLHHWHSGIYLGNLGLLRVETVWANSWQQSNCALSELLAICLLRQEVGLNKPLLLLAILSIQARVSSSRIPTSHLLVPNNMEY